MGKKSKGSRKGKKAWRANISTQDIEDFFEKSTKDALSGGSLNSVSNDTLFYVDKSKGNFPYSFFSLTCFNLCFFFFFSYFMVLASTSSYCLWIFVIPIPFVYVVSLEVCGGGERQLDIGFCYGERKIQVCVQ